jgi:hypothetical protein
MIAVLYIITMASIAWSINWEVRAVIPDLLWFLKCERAQDINFWLMERDTAHTLQSREMAHDVLVVLGAA